MDILGLARLRALDPTLAGELPSSATFVTWLRHAVRGVVKSAKTPRGRVRTLMFNETPATQRG
jgi:hypothetical protein